MNINLGLITIGNGDWKNIIKQLWDSLEINESNYYTRLRANDEYNYKLKMENTDLPANMTNYDLHLKDGNTFKLLISMPFISNYDKNNDMVLFPWLDGEISYRLASRLCGEKVIESDMCDYIIILMGDNLIKEELDYWIYIERMCVESKEQYWIIGNDSECVNYDTIVKWINSGENWCNWINDETIKKVGRV